MNEMRSVQMQPQSSDFRIELSDGSRLAANLMLPDGPGPFPLITTFYPYRKDDFIGSSCIFARRYFASHGYASLLVDVRGYGLSDGPSYEAWDPREALDGAEVVEWSAKQPWCDGNVAIWGASYGGWQALSIASKRPAGLKAIASIYGAAEIYEDFIYPGGCPNALGASSWSAFVLALELAPPGLQDSEGVWLDVWRSRLERLEDGGISSLIWPGHPEFDDYWQCRAIDIESIEVPSFFLAGWRDLLCRGMMDAYHRCKAPKRLLAGPWSHAAPELSAEAPYDSLLELRLWFDRTLKKAAESPERPAAIYFVQRSNSWHSATEWPPRDSADRAFYAGADRKLADAPENVNVHYEGTPLVGTEAGLWFPMGVAFANILEQSRDDAKSLCFTAEPTDRDMVILGIARAKLQLEITNATIAHLCVKLCDVAPDDSSTLITSGWKKVELSGNPRQSLDIELYETAYSIPRGHRLRMTIACGDFPRIWPTAEVPNIVLSSSDEQPSLVLVPITAEGERPAFDPPVPQAGLDRAPWALHGAPIYEIKRDVASGSVAITAGSKLGLRLPQGGTLQLSHSTTAHLTESKPAAACIRTEADLRMELSTGEEIRIQAIGRAGLGQRHIRGRIFNGDDEIFDRYWSTFNGKYSGGAASSRLERRSELPSGRRARRKPSAPSE